MCQHHLNAAVCCNLQDAYQYQNIFGPLVKMEADHDKAMREGQVTTSLQHAPCFMAACHTYPCFNRKAPYPDPSGHEDLHDTHQAGECGQMLLTPPDAVVLLSLGLLQRTP
jgi:hypothetical protein